MSVASETTAKPGAGHGPARRWTLPRWLRDPNPILVKELRSMFRTKRFVRFLYVSTGLVGMLVISLGGGLAASAFTPAQAGRAVYQTFFSAALGLLCLVAPAYAATSLTGEKEAGTYESLILTGIDPARIVWGKFLASFAVFGLVVVALSPLVGLAFLFGGISPGHVVFGFAGLAVVLAPAVALGVAVSARVRSTRVALLAALASFPPASMVGASMLALLGKPAGSAWGLTMEGPFWFAEALATQFFHPDVFLLVVLLPLYLSGMSVWFFLATAIAGVRPAAEDRSTLFKWWTLAALAGLVAMIAGFTGFAGRADAAEVSVALTMASLGPILLFALIFMNEPPLPPREAPSERGSRWRRHLRGLFGPGAVPTVRFAALAIAAAAFGGALSAMAGREALFPGLSEGGRTDIALVSVGLGNVAVGLFALTFGAYVRVVLRSGMAARILTLVLLFVLVALPLLVSLVVDPEGLDRMDESLPWGLLVTPIAHLFVGGAVINDSTSRFHEIAVPLVLYGALALLFWVLLEARVRRVRGVVERQRALQERRGERRAEAAEPDAGGEP